jgi:hypothetical protein
VDGCHLQIKRISHTHSWNTKPEASKDLARNLKEIEKLRKKEDK